MAVETRKLSLILDLKDKASKQLGTFQGKLKSMRPTFKKMTAVGVAGFAAITAAVGRSVMEFAKFEQAEVAFESMLGSAEAAKDMIEELAEFSAKTPFQFGDIVQATRTLVAFGSTGEEAVERIGFLGDIAAGAQVPLADLAQIFGKVQTKGKAMTEEILQMSERGIPIIDELAQQFDVGKEAIFEMAETGQLTAEVVEDALRGMTMEGAIFADQMQKQSQTISGLFSTLKDNLSLLMADVGGLFSEDVAKFTKKLTGLIENLREWIKENPKLAKWIIIITGSIFALMAVLGALLLMLTSAAVSFLILSMTAIPAVLAAMLPLMLGIGALIAIGLVLNKHWQDIWAGMQIVVGEVANGIMAAFEGMINFIVSGINNLVSIVNGLLNQLARIPKIGKQFENLKIKPIAKVEFERFDTGSIYQDAIDRKESKTGVDILSDKMANFIMKDTQQPKESTTVNINGGFFGSDAGEELGDKIIKQLQLKTKL